MLSRCVVLLLALLLCVSARPPLKALRNARAAAASAPGLRALLSQSGASYLASVAVPLIIQRISGLDIPQVQGQTSVPLLGTITYTLTNIQVGTVTYTSELVSLAGGAQGVITGVSVPISLGWKYRQNSWPHITSSGTADVQISDAALAIALAVTADATGHPQLSVQSVVASFDNISVQVHGSILSWLYDLIFDIAKNTIKTDAAKAVESELTQLINVAADKALDSLNLAVPITNLTQLDLLLTQNPQFPSSYVSVYFKGQIENKTNPTPCPLPHSTLPSNAPPQMIEFDVDQFLFNSGLWLIYTDGKLAYTVTQSVIPPEFPFSLNTTTFAGLLPELANAYPNAAIEWALSAASAPYVTISPGGCSLSAVFDMEWLAGYPPAAFQPAFDTQVSLDVDCFFFFNSISNGTFLQGNVSLANFSLEITSSTIGNLSGDAASLNAFFDAIFGGPIISMINQAIEAGFPFPVIEGMSLRNAGLTLNQGFVSLSSDVHYQAPQRLLAALDEYVRQRMQRQLASRRAAAAAAQRHRNVATVAVN
jgi:lipopolysaccharide-binding protein